MNKIFVLVHGAWHNRECWNRVAERLRSTGATVIAPNLLPHGDDGTPYTDVTTMEQYTQPALDAIRSADGPVTLVGHSLGGATLNYLGETEADRVAHLIYVAAALLPNGTAAGDVLFAPRYTRHPDAQGLFQVIAPTDDGRGIAMDLDKPSEIAAAFYNGCPDDVIVAAMDQLVRTTPMTPFESASPITPDRFGAIPRTYVEATADRAIPLSGQRELQDMVPGSERHTFDTSHSPFASQPSALAELLLRDVPPAP